MTSSVWCGCGVLALLMAGEAAPATALATAAAAADPPPPPLADLAGEAPSAMTKSMSAMRKGEGLSATAGRPHLGRPQTSLQSLLGPATTHKTTATATTCYAVI